MKNETSLGAIATIIMGQSPPGETYNTTGDGLPFFQGKAEFGDDFPTAVKWCSAPSRVAEKGDILLSVRAPVGPTNIAQERCCIGRGLASIRAQKGKALTPYLRYFFRRFESEVARRGVGSTFAAINRNDIESLRLVCPPLSQQERIVRILDEADELRRLRAQSDRRTYDLIPSIFSEMFAKGEEYPLHKLSEICAFITKGTTPPSSEIRDVRDYGDIPYLKIYHITDKGDVDFKSNPSFVSNTLHQGLLNRSKVYPRDVLMNIVGPPLGKIGIVPSTFPEWNINQALAIFRATDQIEPIYLLHALRSPKILSGILSQAVGIRQLNISLKQCRDTVIPLPPLSLQQQFAARVTEVRTLEGGQRESRDRLDDLFQSLLHRAFTGEL